MHSEGRRPGEVEYENLFREFYAPLCRHCLRLTGDPDLAEDVAQEAFIRLLEYAETRDVRNPKAWLFTSAMNLVRDRAKLDRTRARLMKRYEPPLWRPTAPDRAMERDERETITREALHSLPDRDARMLLLREAGFSYDEIAGAVGVAETSVGPLLVRARERLREALTRKDAENHQEVEDD